MRVKGAETRRFLVIVLRFGERPAGAVSGARGEDVRRDGVVAGGGIELKAKVKGLTGLSKTSLRLFLAGELKTVGSTFSLSTSSKVHGRLETLLTVGFPAETGFCDIKPSHVSTAHEISCDRHGTPFRRFFALARCCRRGLSSGANGTLAIGAWVVIVVSIRVLLG